MKIKMDISIFETQFNKCFGIYSAFIYIFSNLIKNQEKQQIGINLPLIQFPDNRKVDWVSCGSYYSCVVFTDRNATCFVLVVILLDSLV